MAEARDPAERESLLQMLAVVTIVLLPLPLGVVVWSFAGADDDPNLRVSASPYDLPALVLTVMLLPEMFRATLRRARQPRAWPLHLGLGALAWLLLTTAVHPNWRAVELFAHGLAGAAVAFYLATRDRIAVLTIAATIAFVAGLQAAMGIAQSLTGDVIGLGPLEVSRELRKVGDSYSARGSFVHPYHFTALLMLGLGATFVVRRLSAGHWVSRWTVPVTALIGLAVPLTFSRAALLALAVIVPLGLLTRERALAVVLLATVGAGLLLGWSGWQERGETTADPARATSSRTTRISEAEMLFESEPVWGVGPGNYSIALERTDPPKLLPAHNVVVHFGVEAGAIGGVLAALGVSALAVLSIRGGPVGMIVGASVVNFHLFDSFPHVYPNGVVITGVWIGLIVTARRIRRAGDDLAPDRSHEERPSWPARAETVLP